jgi:response regulator RpfG family c-di-GMP phosphodiesterase
MSDKRMPRVLCVDDEEKLLNAIRRSLRRHCVIETAISGAEGLKLIRESEPFEVVVSDMRMPGMNGAEFLRVAREESPDAVRLLLTGFADLDTVVSAVNEGYIYRFIGKPCTAKELLAAIQDAVKQHELLTSQKVLLEKTLKGCIKALTEILALAAPSAFGRATRISQLAVELAHQLDHPEAWQVEVAALLSQLACITLPQATAAKLYRGQKLEASEQAMVARMPEITEQILADIPRLDDVFAILRERDLDFAPADSSDGAPTGEDIVMGARILRVASDLDALQGSGENSARCYEILRTHHTLYDPVVVNACSRLIEGGALDFDTRGVTVEELRTGMRLSEDMVLESGVLLVPSGQEITVSLLERVRNFDHTARVKEPIWIQWRAEDREDDEAAQPKADTSEQTTATDRSDAFEESCVPDA